MVRRLVAILSLSALFMALSSFGLTHAQSPERAVEFVHTPTLEPVWPGMRSTVQVVVRNTGSATWRPEERYRLSYHWVNRHGRPVLWDGWRSDLPGEVAPGQTVTVSATVEVPRRLGTVMLQWDMLQEGVAWFCPPGSQGNQALPTQAIVLRASPWIDPSAWRDVAWTRWLHFLLVCAVAVGHMTSVAWWVKRSAPHLSAERWLLETMVFGLGSAQVVLHLLAFTVGAVLGRALVLMALLDLIVILIAKRRYDSPSPPLWTSLRVSWVGWVGLACWVTWSLSWAFTVTRSLDVTGTDGPHYHVPHALAYALGHSPWSLAATFYQYPMAHTLLASWFIWSTGDMLLVDLANLPIMWLIMASCALIVYRTNRRVGLSTAPWIMLLLVQMPIVQVCIPFSADLPYTGWFIVLFALCYDSLMRNAWTRRDVALLAIAAGSLVGVKSTGLLSLGVLGLAFSVAGISRYWCAHRTIGLRPRHLTLLLWAAPLALLCGGLWLIRSWYVFGSPVSPLGVTLLGHQIFPGASREQLAYTMSVLADMRDIPAYAPLKQLVFYARRWLGPSFPWLTLGLLAPLAESHVRAVRRKPALSGALCAQWLGVVLVGVIGLPHLIALAGAPWSSLEEWEGLTLRYVTPLIMLYGIFCLTGVLWREADWPLPVRRGLPATWDVAGAFLAVGVVCYWALTKTGPSAEWAFMVFRIETAMTALLIGAALVQHRRRSPTHWRSYTVVGWLLLFISVLSAIALPNQAWLVRRAETEREAEYAVFLDVGRSGNAYRDGLYVALAHEAATGLDGNRRRFFTVGRFLWPLQLQTSEFNTLVLQLDLGRPSLLPLSDRPGAGSCDYVIVAPDVAGAVEGGHLDRFLYPGCTPVLIGSSAGFQIYHVE